jgi:CRISPR-associated exonuclease Cas4
MFERDHENVEIGRYLHGERYSREEKEVHIGRICIDFVHTGDEVVLHEVKKTKALEDAHTIQMKYYLYCLINNGIKCRGEINYPLLNKKMKVELSEDDKLMISNALEDISRIISEGLPKAIRRKICRKCAYEDFCFSGVGE